MRLALSQQLLTLQQSHHHMVRQGLVAAGSMLSVRHRVCDPIIIVAMGPAGTNPLCNDPIYINPNYNNPICIFCLWDSSGESTDNTWENDCLKCTVLSLACSGACIPEKQALKDKGVSYPQHIFVLQPQNIKRLLK